MKPTILLPALQMVALAVLTACQNTQPINSRQTFVPSPTQSRSRQDLAATFPKFTRDKFDKMVTLELGQGATVYPCLDTLSSTMLALAKDGNLSREERVAKDNEARQIAYQQIKVLLNPSQLPALDQWLHNELVAKGATSQSAETTISPPAPSAASRGTARYAIDIEVAFNSEITRGQNRVMVELRQGVPGGSTVFDTKYFDGQTATVSFWNMPAGSYFLAIGNGDSVAVGPVHQFSDGQSKHSKVRVTQSSGNIGTRSRSGL